MSETQSIDTLGDLVTAEIIRSSDLFCETWYRETYPDVAWLGIDPALHYLLYGARLGRNPGPRFDTKLYSVAHPASLRTNPLLHFLLTSPSRGEDTSRSHPGHAPACDPRVTVPQEPASAAPPGPTVPCERLVRPHFDAAFYLEQGVSVPAGEDPLRHYLTVGWRLGLSPNRWFDPIGYTALHRQIGQSGTNPFLYYLRRGLLEKAAPNPYFEERAFLRPPVYRPGAHEYGPEAHVLPFTAPSAPTLSDPGRICVHVHAFYLEMLGDVVTALARIPTPFTLLVSIPEGQNAAAVQAFLESGPASVESVIVRAIPNRGRDVAPWAVDFRDEILASDIFCHFHTKQSVHAGDHRYWFRFLCHSILGSPAVVAGILNLFARDATVGLVSPAYWPMLRRQPNFGKAGPEFDRLLSRIGVRTRHDLCPDYPAGSFFWCRTRILTPLLEAGLTREDFPEERGQICGTLAHAVERAIGALPQEQGMRTVFVVPDRPHELIEQMPLEVAFSPDDLVRSPDLTVSVVMPTWNRRATLPAALASAFGQSVPPKEVIVVDDGSSDGTVEFVRRTYAKRLADGSLKLIAADHQGVSAARNAGLDAATGDIIAYLDSDNTWRPEYLAHVVTAYSRHPNALSAYTDLLIHDADRTCTEVLSRPYDRAALLHRNFIDLNVFSHRRGIRRQRFDLGLKRLVDWEFILSVTAERAPLHIVHVGADYHLDKARLGNITHTVPLRDNMARVYRKHRRERVFHGCEPLSFAIKCPAPSRDAGRAWGDLYFANSLCSALERLGCRTRIDLLEAWNTEEGENDDVVIVLRGLSAYKPRPRHINFMWHISHPDKVRVEEMQQYDHVFVASHRETQALHGKLGTKVSVLLQCADPDLFYAGPTRPTVPAHELLFVGNSRGVDRWMPSTCVEHGLPITVYGRGWENRLPEAVIGGSHVRNERLSDYYRAAKIVLNDHWPDMARRGFISNRIFDAGLSGALVVSDDFEGKEIFFGSVLTCRNVDQFEARTRFFLANEDARRGISERLRQIVALSHTFDHRARDLLRVARRLAAFRLGLPAGVAASALDAPSRPFAAVG